MKKYDVVVIGLGPAGMAVTNMASEMGLKVLAVESRNIGGECSNTGCIPSKALLAISEKNPMLAEPFARINADIDHIRENRISSLSGKADILLGQGPASFVNGEVIRVGEEEYTGKHIFIATGTRPFIPPIEGLDKVEYLTNENLFQLEAIPESLTFIGGGAIACEMSQAFARMGCKCTIVHDRPYLLPNGEKEAGEFLQRGCEKLGITVYNSRVIARVSKRDNGRIVVRTRDGEEIESEKLVVAAGRSYDFSSLHLENAGVEYGRKGIVVDDYLRTTNKHIHAIGDCNGSYLLSHAAMHQGMLALMNTMMMPPLKKKYLKYPVPWTVFTEPQVSHVGRTSAELDAEHIDYEMVETKYSDYENAVAGDKGEGYVRVYASSAGRIYGVSIVGANSGEMINEWALAIQHNIGLYDLMMTMHSFPTMGFLSKRIGENWMMKKMQPGFVKKLLKLFF
ncbi:NAD(P)/FAD-dependent oxidoreductase [Oxalobacter sp. OttesenSCG-928-P03]|nr:NAD(P)/FAD-dependent oxidoreductase [Oxalobacter sp. OttesenSCG-928-P03]